MDSNMIRNEGDIVWWTPQYEGALFVVKVCIHDIHEGYFIDEPNGKAVPEEELISTKEEAIYILKTKLNNWNMVCNLEGFQNSGVILDLNEWRMFHVKNYFKDMPDISQEDFISLFPQKLEGIDWFNTTTL